ncbi:MAG: hypothetical protein KTR22_15385 [Flavobacteriaceae bacterium]|nr:hypothetical protein [Flavobacteriaceae bacterium]
MTKKTDAPVISFRTAFRIALWFFGIGTFLFLFQLLLGEGMYLVFIGIVFLFVAIVFNGFILLILIVDLIRKDILETFFAICVILANIPIALGYTYILIEYI